MQARYGLLLFVVTALLPPAVVAQALPVFDQSRVYFREADFQAAIQPYQAAIAADARNVQGHYWLGFAYLFTFRQYRAGLAPYAAGYLPRAVASLRRAVELDAAFGPAVLALHDALVLSGLLDEADAVLRAYVQRNRPAGPPHTFPKD